MNDASQDALRRLLRTGDPASSLPPLRSDQIVRLSEDTVNPQNARPRPRVNRRGVLVGALCAGAAAIAAVAFAVPAIIGTSVTATALTQPDAGGPAAMCAQVTPEAVEAAGTSFRAAVRSIADGTVTLAVTERFAGEVSDTVTVTQGQGAGIDGEPIVFVDGESYLLSASSDGVIITCGVSGVADEGLTAVYDAAFG
ncbi:hypothetical protein [Microbacterium sp. lyk4-40-TSB-66]|uniref:hypothetical protein n=1 Tax=Microbacterium sp. lyk4-40-TSB-66 TaxID=3040294 RepID=UPI00254B37AE|nr:hypothetical protein [Microbacterium sp. lyk4-40-TSB-66]